MSYRRVAHAAVLKRSCDRGAKMESSQIARDEILTALQVREIERRMKRCRLYCSDSSRESGG